MHRPAPGHAIRIAPGVRTVLASNPGPMTYLGTNSYLLGEDEIAIVDPGPDDAAHRSALLQAASHGTVTHIIVTHAHADHSAGAKALATLTGAPIYAFGGPKAGRRPTMQGLGDIGDIGGGEGVDHGFSPDIHVADKDRLCGAGWALDVVHLPGHFAGHIALKFGDLMMTGDHVMDWASSVVSPPDGHLGDFLASCHRLIAMAPKTCLTGHGAPIDDPKDRLEWLISHRKMREEQILTALGKALMSIDALVAEIYRDIPRNLHPAAARNVLAHLLDLSERGIIEAAPGPANNATFRMR